MGHRRSLVAAVAALVLVLAAPALAGPPLYAITVTIQGEGEVLLDPVKDGYQKNNVVTLTAVPADGWSFDRWEGDLAGDANPTTLRVSGPHQVTAGFVEEGGSGGGGGTEPPPPERPPLPDDGLIVGYFTQWGIYRRDYLPVDIVTSGTAGRVDVINYAFAGIDENLECVSLDEYADIAKRYDAAEAVDGVADTVSQPLKGNFNQLRKLKQMFPHIRVLLSIGGWTESAGFSDAALPANREAFVSSCIERFITGEVSPGVSVAGVFDGLDIDWEYPGRCGDTCDYREVDGANFTALLSEFRAELDAVELTTGTELLLTIAAPAGAYLIEPMDLDAIHPHLDWINVMAYDFHGGWEPTGPTNHQANLFSTACDAPGATTADQAMGTYLAAGIPGSKLLLGVPFYGRGWTGVAPGPDRNGVCQPARGLPRGTFEKGVDDYEVLAGESKPSYHDEEAGAHWTYDGREFWTFDDPVSLGWKAGYILETGLRGAMFWEMSGDTPDGELIAALDAAFQPGP